MSCCCEEEAAIRRRSRLLAESEAAAVQRLPGPDASCLSGKRAEDLYFWMSLRMSARKRKKDYRSKRRPVNCRDSGSTTEWCQSGDFSKDWAVLSVGACPWNPEFGRDVCRWGKASRAAIIFRWREASGWRRREGSSALSFRGRPRFTRASTAMRWPLRRGCASYLTNDKWVFGE